MRKRKYKWIGRYNAQDVFTYLKMEDVEDLIFEILPYKIKEG